VLKPLIGSLKGGIAQPVQWTDEKRAAFVAAKQLLTDATCLAHLRADAEIQLVVDASNTHIGAVLQQSSERLPAPGILLQKTGCSTDALFNI
jgi:propanediol utilization protein